VRLVLRFAADGAVLAVATELNACRIEMLDPLDAIAV